MHLPALTDFESVDPAPLTVPKTSSSVDTVFDGVTLSPPPWKAVSTEELVFGTVSRAGSTDSKAVRA